MATRALTAGDAPACDAIIAGLPYFFGIDAGVSECARAVRGQRGFVVEEAGRVRGFLTVDRPPSAPPEVAVPEITWMAVDATRRRGGLGGALVEAVAGELSAEGERALSVLTQAAAVPETGPDTYAGTRAFYRKAGFIPIREIHPPGWDVAALLLVRPLPGRG
ncbi:MAG TPA: GNAT family N-acetyltransferase [Rugosimonospora sp.]